MTVATADLVADLGILSGGLILLAVVAMISYLGGPPGGGLRGSMSYRTHR